MGNCRSMLSISSRTVGWQRVSFWVFRRIHSLAGPGIIGIADAYDAMTADRPYHKGNFRGGGAGGNPKRRRDAVRSPFGGGICSGHIQKDERCQLVKAASKQEGGTPDGGRARAGKTNSKEAENRRDHLGGPAGTQCGRSDRPVYLSRLLCTRTIYRNRAGQFDWREVALRSG